MIALVSALLLLFLQAGFGVNVFSSLKKHTKMPQKLKFSADSAMLDPKMCGTIHPLSTSNKTTDNHTFGEDDDGSKCDSANTNGIQAHLGAFASEGLQYH